MQKHSLLKLSWTQCSKLGFIFWTISSFPHWLKNNMINLINMFSLHCSSFTYVHCCNLCACHFDSEQNVSPYDKTKILTIQNLALTYFNHLKSFTQYKYIWYRSWRKIQKEWHKSKSQHQWTMRSKEKNQCDQENARKIKAEEIGCKMEEQELSMLDKKKRNKSEQGGKWDGGTNIFETWIR